MIKNLYCKKREEIVTMEECFKCSRERLVKECDIIPEYLLYIKEKLEEETDELLSVTKLLGCPRRAYLQSWAELTVPVEDFYFLLRGAMSHLIMEKYKVEKDCIIETRFEREYEGIMISGKPDKIDLKTKTIYDYKTITGRMSDDYSLRWNNARLKDQIQLNIYKWLVEEKFDIQHLEVIYLSSDSIKRIPVRIRKEGTRYYAEVKKVFERAKILKPFWGKPFEEGMKLPPVERNWLCNYCWAKEICEEYERRFSIQKI